MINFLNFSFAMTQFLHNLYLLIYCDGIDGVVEVFVMNLNGGPKNETNLYLHRYCHRPYIWSINPSPAQSAEQLYQKGLMKEEGEGALQEAMTEFIIRLQIIQLLIYLCVQKHFYISECVMKNREHRKLLKHIRGWYLLSLHKKMKLRLPGKGS